MPLHAMLLHAMSAAGNNQENIVITVMHFSMNRPMYMAILLPYFRSIHAC